MKVFVTSIVSRFNKMNIKHEIHSFDSGAFMIDFWVGDNFYCIQLYKEEIGISLITDKTLPFDIIPDLIFKSLEDLKSIKF